MSEDTAQTLPDRARVMIIDQTIRKRYQVVVPTGATVNQLLPNIIR